MPLSILVVMTPTHIPDILMIGSTGRRYPHMYLDNFMSIWATLFTSYNHSHGTRCAGEVAAARNGRDAVGVAYDSKIAGTCILLFYDCCCGSCYRCSCVARVAYAGSAVYDRYYWSSVDGLQTRPHRYLQRFVGTHRWWKDMWWTPQANDEVNCTRSQWGSDHTAYAVLPCSFWISCVSMSILQGRDGKGSIYVWASGDGGPDDDCNCDGYAASMWTISINSVTNDGETAGYDESCSSTLASTFSNGKAGYADAGVVSSWSFWNLQLSQSFITSQFFTFRQQQICLEMSQRGTLVRLQQLLRRLEYLLSLLRQSKHNHCNKQSINCNQITLVLSAEQ